MVRGLKGRLLFRNDGDRDDFVGCLAAIAAGGVLAAYARRSPAMRTRPGTPDAFDSMTTRAAARGSGVGLVPVQERFRPAGKKEARGAAQRQAKGNA